MRFLCLTISFLIFSLNQVSAQQESPIHGTTILETTTSWDGKPLQYPKGEAKVTGVLIEIAPGAETGWHLHPAPNFGYVLEGMLEVKLEDGQAKQLNAGEALAEVVNTYHNGKNIGDIPVKIVVFYAGITDQELTKMKE
jgi:quercetin dioxygenase-like cupin family protein